MLVTISNLKPAAGDEREARVNKMWTCLIKIWFPRMSKALTPVNQNGEREIDSIAGRLSTRARQVRFPSYFGNFGIFKLFLMFRVEARVSKRPPGKKHEFPLITAFMAIV